VAIQERAKSRDIDRIFLQELRDANEILRSADPQRVCNNMLWR
jgi:hypothetical protein